MRYYRRITLAVAVLLLQVPGFSQDFTKDLEGNIERTAGIFHSYEACEAPGTPAPEGYVPVYVSHYGRHGSRRQAGAYATLPYETMLKADSLGLLTPLGKEFLEDVKKVYAPHEGMQGELTERGAREHAGIAQRMYGRFSQAFSGGLVRCQASIVPRCIISMANFTSSLKSQSPSTCFSFVTGEKYLELLAREAKDRDSWRGRPKAAEVAAGRELLDPERLMKALFVSGKEETLNKLIPDARSSIVLMFYFISDCQDLLYELDGFDMYKYFTKDELIALGKVGNERFYTSIGNSTELGDNITWSAKPLLKDIISRADEALASAGEGRIAADLRFGHDSGLLPLAALMDIEGPSGRYPIGTAWKNGFYIWKYIPMAANLQLAFYRNGQGEVLVKILYNEVERRIPALGDGPYYDWNNLREYLLQKTVGF